MARHRCCLVLQIRQHLLGRKYLAGGSALLYLDRSTAGWVAGQSTPAGQSVATRESEELREKQTVVSGSPHGFASVARPRRLRFQAIVISSPSLW
jgi:hypothetical protein